MARQSYQICTVCKGRGILPDERLGQPPCAACAGEGIARQSYAICSICGGWGRLPLDPAEDLGPLVVFVEAGTPRTAHRELVSLFRMLRGPLRIVDPYYGTGSLFRLDHLTHCSPIMFLTQTADRNERSFLTRALAEFGKEHRHVTFREDQSGTLHDRYILSDDQLLLLGHGLKDVGGKDSFVVCIARELAGDLLVTIREAFDRKWALAQPIG